MGKENRIYALDNLKGALIILVVLGHCIQYSTNNFDNIFLFRFIYAFHMPLFMWVSGYVNYREGDTDLRIIKRRSIQLVLPFVSWTILTACLSQNFSYIWDVVLNPTLSVWFIWDLFLIICFSTLVNYYSEKYKKENLISTIIAFFLAEAIVKIFNINILDISHALDMGVFYIIGFFMHKYKIKFKVDNIPYWIIFTCFIILCVFWQRKSPPTFIPKAPLVVGTLWKMLTALLGCLVIPNLFFCFVKKYNKYLTYLGTQTLGIYVIHQMLLFKMLNVMVRWIDFQGPFYYVYIVLLAALTLVISQVINLQLQKFRLTAFLLLGKRYSQ